MEFTGPSVLTVPKGAFWVWTKIPFVINALLMRTANDSVHHPYPMDLMFLQKRNNLFGYFSTQPYIFD